MCFETTISSYNLPPTIPSYNAALQTSFVEYINLQVNYVNSKPDLNLEPNENYHLILCTCSLVP